MLARIEQVLSCGLYLRRISLLIQWNIVVRPNIVMRYSLLRRPSGRFCLAICVLGFDVWLYRLLLLSLLSGQIRGSSLFPILKLRFELLVILFEAQVLFLQCFLLLHSRLELSSLLGQLGFNI